MSASATCVRDPLRVLCALDSFKDCRDAASLGAHVSRSLHRLFLARLSPAERTALSLDSSAAASPQCPYLETRNLPLSDGGEGFLDALPSGAEQAKDSDLVAKPTAVSDSVVVYGPLGNKLPFPPSSYYRVLNGVAYIEMARVSGLEAVPEASRSPFLTTTYGTGQLIRDAYDRGIPKIVVGLGGSATNDGGLGALQALGVTPVVRPPDGEQKPVEMFFGRHLATLDHVELPGGNGSLLLPGAEVVLACDVDNPFVGPDGAVAVFGSQKGASPEDQIVLEAGMLNASRAFLACGGRSIADVPGAGAAGGLGGGLMALVENVSLRSGLEVIAEANCLEDAIRESDIVITGEGCYDAQTARGKVVAHVQSLARRHNKPVVVLCGLNKTKEGVNERVLELMSMFNKEQSFKETEMCIDGLLDKHWDALQLPEMKTVVTDHRSG